MTQRQRSILAVATLTQAVAMGVTLGVFPLVLEPLEASLDASRPQISVGPILIMFALAAAGVFAGGILDKGRIRRAMLFGTGLLWLALMIASSASHLAVLGIAALLAGFSIPFIGPLAGMTLVTRLFTENQGRAFGIMSMGPALGMGFFAGVAGFLLQSLEWRSIYLLLAGVTVSLLVPAVWFVIPEQLDAPSKSEGDTDGSDAGEGTEDDIDLGHVVRRPVFWLSALVFALSAGIATGWTNHVAAFLGEFDMTESQVTSLVAAQFWMGVPGALVFGTLSDRLPVTGLYISMLGFEAIAFAAFGSGISALAVAILGVAFGFVMGGLIPLYMALLGSRLEPQILGRAMGLSNLVMLPIMAIATIGAAWIHEGQNSYSLAAMIFAGGMMAAIVTLLLSNRSAVES
jgi:MFS family permease